MHSQHRDLMLYHSPAKHLKLVEDFHLYIYSKLFILIGRIAIFLAPFRILDKIIINNYFLLFTMKLQRPVGNRI